MHRTEQKLPKCKLLRIVIFSVVETASFFASILSKIRVAFVENSLLPHCVLMHVVSYRTGFCYTKVRRGCTYVRLQVVQFKACGRRVMRLAAQHGRMSLCLIKSVAPLGQGGKARRPDLRLSRSVKHPVGPSAVAPSDQRLATPILLKVE